ncbi:hypothetical protein IKO50_00485 [bacterium]|nr:hypothetical protein [bacterium]
MIEKTNNIEEDIDNETEDLNEQTIKDKTNANLKENFDIDKEKIKKQLEATKNVEERVKLFSKRTDSY